MSIWRSVLVLVFLLTTGSLSYAQTPSCGDIVIPSGFYDLDFEEDRSPITDCTNPFNADGSVNFTYQASLSGVGLAQGQVVEISATTTEINGQFSYNYPDTIGSAHLSVFRKDGADYRLALTAGAGDFTWSGVEEGEYTAVVVYEFAPILNQRNWWEQLWGYVVPSAYAYYPSFYEVTAFDFSVVRTEQPPAGASSVLFLPGIQASRLYKDGLFGTEDQVWPPNSLFNNDVEDLAMTPSGESEEDVYTRDVIDESLGVGTVYGDFLSFLEAQKSAAVPIKSYRAFAYDWRFDADTIAEEGTKYENEIQNVINVINSLAQDSYTGKVTIIAHSNGGLLAKSILRKMEASGTAGIVDKLVFLGTPHLGTPKAIGTALHGYDQTDSLGGLVIDGHEVRKVVNNMPGLYGLLPSLAYIHGLNTPIISFETGSATQPYRDTYGEQIDGELQYRAFMYGSDVLNRDLGGPLSNPARVNTALFNEGLRQHEELYDNWHAPGHIGVYEIVGVGLPTMQSITYRTVTEQKCTTAGTQILCVDEAEIKPFANLSRWGDATVIDRSAEGYVGDKQAHFVNLFDLIDQYAPKGIMIEHYNLTESTEVMSLLAGILSGTSASNTYDFITTQKPQISEEWSIETVDSPVRMLATDNAGNRAGVIVSEGERKIFEEIPGSQYFEFGDTKYLIVPKEVERTVRLYGEGRGGYSLQTADLLSNDSTVVRTRLINATVTPTMVAEYVVNSAGYGTLKTDLDGDNVFETVTDLNGNPIVGEVVTYESLYALVQNSTLTKARKSALLVIIRNAEKASKSRLPPKLRKRAEDALLDAGILLVRGYVKRGQISEGEGETLILRFKNMKYAPK